VNESYTWYNSLGSNHTLYNMDLYDGALVLVTLYDG